MKFPCERCQYRFPCPTDLTRHYQRATPCKPEDIEKIKCKICSLQCFSLGEFKSHCDECIKNKLEKEKKEKEKMSLISQMDKLIDDIKNISINFTNITEDVITTYNKTYNIIKQTFKLHNIVYHNTEAMSAVEEWITEIITNTKTKNKKRIPDSDSESESCSCCSKKSRTIDNRSNMNNITNMTNTINSNNITNSNNTSNTIYSSKTRIDAKSLINNGNIIFRDAKGLSDCLSPDNITQDMIEDCVAKPVDEIVEYILERLCGMDNVLIRPLHRTTKSGDYMIKRSQRWYLDSDGTKICEMLMPVVEHAYKRIHALRMKGVTFKNDPSRYITNAKRYATEIVTENMEKACSIGLENNFSFEKTEPEYRMNIKSI